jgi:hypothetical protein
MSVKKLTFNKPCEANNHSKHGGKFIPVVCAIAQTVVLTSSILSTGDLMAQKTKVAERGALTQNEINELQVRYNNQFKEAKAYANDVSIGIPTGEAGMAKIRPDLIKTLKEINGKFKSYNNGNDFIVIPKDDVALSTGELERIDRQVKEAVATVKAGSGLAYSGGTDKAKVTYSKTDSTRIRDSIDIIIDTAIYGSKAAGSGKTDTNTVIPQPKAHQDTIPRKQVMVPATIPVPQLTQTERDAYGQIIDNLKAISNSGATAAIRQETKVRAKRLHDRISTEITKLGGPQTATEATESIMRLGNLKGEYERERTYESALTRAQAAALTSAPTQLGGIPVKEAPKHPLQQQLTELQKILQGMKEADRAEAANAILSMLPKVWLLSEDEKARGAMPGTGPRWEVFQILQSAAENLKNGDVAGTKNMYAQAVRVFEREQNLLEQRANVLKQLVDGTVAAIKASSLPTGAELMDAEKKEGVRTKPGGKGPAFDADKERVERERFYHTTKRGVRNGKEDLEAAMLNRQEQIRELLANNKGRLSYNQIADLEQTAGAESRAINSLIAMWNYSSTRLDNADPITRKTAWRNYSIAAATLADPDPETAINPYESYPKELRDFLISQFKRATGSYAMSEEAVIAALMRNLQRKYDDVLYGAYITTYRLAPVNETTEKLAKTLAELRTVRVLCENDYAQYVYATENEANVANKLADMRAYLDSAVHILTASGVSPTGLLVATAYEWMKKEVPGDMEGRKALADAYRSMAMNLGAIREAEVWKENVAAIGNPAVTGAMLAKADEIIAAAKEEFKWVFSVPETNGSYYPDLPRSIADVATRMLAPAGLAVTEAHATYQVIFESEFAKTATGKISDEALEKSRKPDENRMREAQLQDRNAAVAAGRKAEGGHMKFLIGVRKNPDFERPYAITGDAAAANAFSTLSPNNGRFPENRETGRPRPTVARADLHKDTWYKPHEPAAVHPKGWLYGEFYRQEILHGDKNAPSLLRNLDVDTFSGTAAGISLRYGDRNVTPQTQLGEANKAFMMILDARIAELEARLNGSVEANVDGEKKMVPIRRFATSEDPRRYFVVRAQEALEDAKLLRQKYDWAMDNYMFSGTYEKTPKQAIMSVEQAIASLSDGNFNFKPGKEEEVKLQVRISQPEYHAVPMPGIGKTLWAFYGAEVTALSGKDSDARGETPDQYETRTGEKMNLTYLWMFTSEIRNDYILVANPHLYEKGHETEAPFVARVMRNMPQRLADGSTAYPVIKALPPGTATGETQNLSKALDYELVYDQGVPKVLCHVREKVSSAGSVVFEPVESGKELADEARNFLFKPGGKDVAQVVSGQVQAAVIVMQK